MHAGYRRECAHAVFSCAGPRRANHEFSLCDLCDLCGSVVNLPSSLPSSATPKAAPRFDVARDHQN
jgi:hypothetical protein